LATGRLLGLFLLFSHVNLILCHCVSLDEAVKKKKNRFSVFSFISLLIASNLSGVCLLWSVVPFFASKSAVSFPCIPKAQHVSGDNFAHPQEH
jgi:hypothetical protein